MKKEINRSKSNVNNGVDSGIDTEISLFEKAKKAIIRKGRASMSIVLIAASAMAATGCNSDKPSSDSAIDRQKIKEAMKLDSPESVIYVLAHLKKIDPNASRIKKIGHKKAMEESAKLYMHQLTINRTGKDNYSQEDMKQTMQMLADQLHLILHAGDMDTLTTPGVQALLRELELWGYIEMQEPSSTASNSQESKTNQTGPTHKSLEFEDVF